MIISFVNYEVRVKLETKSNEDIRDQQEKNATFFAEQARKVHDELKNSGFVAASGMTVGAPDNSAALEEERLRQEAADKAEAERVAQEAAAAAAALEAANAEKER
jgi:hypothetical protein